MPPERRTLDRNTKLTAEHLMEMHRLTAEAISGAIACLDALDPEKARAVVAGDQRVNDLRNLVEAECVRTIATQQPVARDLRALLADTHIAGELERIADHAVDIARIVLKGEIAEPVAQLGRINEMGTLVEGMLERVMDAYFRLDADLAYAVGETDNQADALDAEIVEGLLDVLCDEPSRKRQGAHLLWIEHNLERIGDRVTNIAERVVFMVTGKTPDLN